MTLRKKLILAFFLFALVPIGVLATLATLGSFALADRRARQDLGRTLTTLSDLIDREVESERFLLARLTQRVVVEPGLSPRSQLERFARNEETVGHFNREPRLAVRVLVQHPSVADTLVVEGSFAGFGRLVTLRASFRPSDPEDPSGPGGTSDAAGGSAPLPEARTHFPPTGATLTVAIPVSRADGPRSGTLFEEMSIQTLFEHVMTQTAFQQLDEAFAAAREAGEKAWRFLYHSDPTRIGLAIGAEDGVPTAPYAREGTASSRRDESPSTERWTFVKTGSTLRGVGLNRTTGWLLGGSISLAPYLAPVRASARIGLALIALMALLVTAGIVLVTRGVGGTVEEIAESAGAIARGDFQRTIRVRRRDEFGEIAEHINEMARDLMMTAESRSITGQSSRLVHDLKGVASQMNLLLYNLQENYDDPEFRAEFPALMKQLVGQVESLALELRRGGRRDEIRAEPCDLDALLGRIVEGRRPGLPAAIRVDLELGAGRPVVTNGEMLAGILENLVANAVEAMEHGGTLTVRAGPADERRSRGADHAPTHFIEIEDTGRGMSREFIETGLFQPFVTTKEKGLGLGMYQVRQDVTRLGGTIDVRSRPGHGTRVRIEVGRHEEHPDR